MADRITMQEGHPIRHADCDANLPPLRELVLPTFAVEQVVQAARHELCQDAQVRRGRAHRVHPHQVMVVEIAQEDRLGTESIHDLFLATLVVKEFDCAIHALPPSAVHGARGPLSNELADSNLLKL